MREAHLSITVGRVLCDTGTFATTFYASSDGFSRLVLTGAEDHDEVRVFIGPGPYSELKAMLRKSESVAKQLAGMSANLPWKHIDLPMTLRVECGRVQTDDQYLAVDLVVDESSRSKLSLYLSNDDGESVLLYFNQHQYKELKELIRSTDETIARLIRDGQAPAGFLET